MSCLATYLQRARSFLKPTTHYRLIPLLKAFLSSAAKKKKKEIHENFNLALFWKSGALQNWYQSKSLRNLVQDPPCSRYRTVSIFYTSCSDLGASLYRWQLTTLEGTAIVAGSCTMSGYARMKSKTASFVARMGIPPTNAK